ncbi:MAG: flavoprotein [Desulfurococcaceae archaeon]
MKPIAWGITGAGAYLYESVESIKTLIKATQVTVYVSRAGAELLRTYGLLDELLNSVKNDYPSGIVFEHDEPSSYPLAMRVYRGVYEAVIVSPASLNTVSKIVHGIADNLVSNLVIHALKNNIRVFIVPVDLFEIKSRIPVVLDRSKCISCRECIASTVCSTGALTKDSVLKVKLNLAKCNMCRLCRSVCPWRAIEYDVEIVVKPHTYYSRIVSKLYEIDGLTVAKSPIEVLKYLGVA